MTTQIKARAWLVELWLNRKSRFVLIFVLCGTMIGVSSFMMLRCVYYTMQHGGGVPCVEDGKQVLNSHGKITPVPPDIYREAVSRWRYGIAAIIITFLFMFGILLLNLLTIRKAGRRRGQE